MPTTQQSRASSRPNTPAPAALAGAPLPWLADAESGLIVDADGQIVADAATPDLARAIVHLTARPSAAAVADTLPAPAVEPVAPSALFDAHPVPVLAVLPFRLPSPGPWVVVWRRDQATDFLKPRSEDRDRGAAVAWTSQPELAEVLIDAAEATNALLEARHSMPTETIEVELASAWGCDW